MNNNEPLTEDDQTLYEVIKNEDVIVIINKTDLEQRLDMNEVKRNDWRYAINSNVYA